MNIANITPSTRDLMQFISPNPGKRDRLILIEDTAGTGLGAYAEKFKAWEDAEISGLIVVVPTACNLAGDYLKSAIETLSCPIIRLADAKACEDIAHSRQIGFDAQIVSSQSFPHAENILAKAQAMHFRIIFRMASRADVEFVKALAPRFVYLDAELPAAVEIPQQTTWIIGRAGLAGVVPLKCVVEGVD